MNEDEGSRLDRGGYPRVIRVRLVLTLKLEQLICAELHHLSETKTLKVAEARCKGKFRPDAESPLPLTNIKYISNRLLLYCCSWGGIKDLDLHAIATAMSEESIAHCTMKTFCTIYVYNCIIFRTRIFIYKIKTK